MYHIYILRSMYLYVFKSTKYNSTSLKTCAARNVLKATQNNKKGKDMEVEIK